jgi:NTE family protein
MGNPRIGLALGSGAARGWSHIGVIEGLAEAEIEPEIVCGCSIGALVGAAYVAGELPALKDFAQSPPGGKSLACSTCGCPAEA